MATKKQIEKSRRDMVWLKKWLRYKGSGDLVWGELTLKQFKAKHKRELKKYQAARKKRIERERKYGESFSAEEKMGESAWVVTKEWVWRNPSGVGHNIGETETVRDLAAVYLSTAEAKRGFNLSKGTYSGDWKESLSGFAYPEQEQTGYKHLPWGSSVPMTIKWKKVPIRRFGYDTLTHQKERDLTPHQVWQRDRGLSAESFSADSRWIGSHCRDCGEAKPFNEIEIMAGNARCKPGKGCKQFTKEQMEETERQMRNEYPDLEWGAESLADRVPFPSSVPSAGTGSPGQMCEVCNESDDLPYDSDYFKNCRRCGKTVCHECWDTDIESDDDYHEVCMDCWTVLDNVARYDAEGDVTEDLAEVRTDLSQKRTNMSALRTALSVAGLFLVWDSWRWSKEERKLKGL